METFAEVVRAHADDEKVGIHFDGAEWTWEQAVQEAADRAASVRALQPADRPVHVGVLLENVPDYALWILAAGLGGFVVVGLNSTRRGEGLARDIRHTDCDLVVTERSQLDRIAGLDLGIPEERVLNVDEAAYEAFLAPHRGAALPTELPPADRTLLLLFSSGSTGAPKAVICTQGRLGWLAQAMADRVGLRRDSVTYLCMPLFHGNSIMMNLAPSLHRGAQMCMVRRFSASGFSPDIHRLGVTYVNYVGRALHYVLTQPAAPEDPDSPLEIAFGNEASLKDVEAFGARFGCEVIEGYGMSEGVVRLSRTPDTPEDALGLPAGSFDVKVLHADGTECPPAKRDETGRILNPAEAIGQIVAIGGARGFEGYYKNPEAHAERIRGDDFWTGDLAYRDEDGFFYFAGRSADWLRVDGENFSAAPVERIIQRWQPAQFAVVYPVADARTGDQVMCTVQLDEPEGFDPDDFSRFLADQPDMGTKWWPRFVRVVAVMPTTGPSKAAKARLRQTAWATDDPVYWRRDPRSSRYVRFTAEDRRAWEEVFSEHGREVHLPATA